MKLFTRLSLKGRLFLFLLLNLLMFCLIAEIFLRFFLYSPTRVNASDTFDKIPYYKPNTFMVYGSEGFAKRKINNFGFLDEDWPDRLDKSVTYIMGNSFAAGREVPLDKTFIHYLRNRYPNDIFFNFGIPGTKGVYPLKLFKHYKKTFPVKRVVLFLSSLNISQLCFGQQKNFTEGDEALGFIERLFRLRKSGRWILEKSALATYLFYEWNVTTQIRFFQELRDKNDGEVKFDPSVEKKQHLLKVALKFFKGWKSEIEDREFILVHVPSLPKYNSELTFSEKTIFFADILKQVANQYNFKFIDLTESYRDYFKRGQVVVGFHNAKIGRGHFNFIGHQMAFEAISGVLDNVR